MRKLIINRLYFTNSDCFKANARQTVAGIQVHSTGANNPNLKRYVQPDDGRLGKNAYGNHHNRAGKVCASAYIGKLADDTVAIYQVLPWNIRCWLSGNGENGNANRLGFVGFEICEDNLENRDYFDAAVMGAAVNLTAHLCMLHGLTVKDARDHRELHEMGFASDHGDIQHWTRKFGLTMDDFRAEVQQAMDEGVDVEYIDAGDASDETEGSGTGMAGTTDVLSRGFKGPAVKRLQERLLALGYKLPKYGVDGDFGAETEAAVKAAQRDAGFAVTGVVDAQTWGYLTETGAGEANQEILPIIENVTITLPRAGAGYFVSGDSEGVHDGGEETTVPIPKRLFEDLKAFFTQA